MSFEVAGQRTSNLLRLGRLLALYRGGSNKNRVGILKDDKGVAVIGLTERHLNLYSIAGAEANKTFAHFSWESLASLGPGQW